MFYNPDDVKYFKPVELATKLGLKVIYLNLSPREI